MVNQAIPDYLGQRTTHNLFCCVRGKHHTQAGMYAYGQAYSQINKTNHACGFWFLPMAWQFSCDKCMELSGNTNSSSGGMLCANHFSLEHFLTRNAYSSRPIFVGLSSIGRCVLIQYYSYCYFYSFYPGACALQWISNKYWNYVSTHRAIHRSQILFFNLEAT